MSSFFGDREAFKQLERVIPKLFEATHAKNRVRVWAAGCGTGEEAYSIAMLLAEYADQLPASPSVQVFATDIDDAAIAVARQGAYPATAVADVSSERLRRFFTSDGEVYRVQKPLRELVIFAHHDLLTDPPFAHLDLLSCRHLLTSFNRHTQRRALRVMHFALKTGGFLLLSSRESVEAPADLFTAEPDCASLFQCRAVPVPDIASRRTHEAPSNPNTAEALPPLSRLSAAEVHRRLVEEYAAPSIMVKENHEIAHISTRAGRYLQLASGEPSQDVLALIRPELRPALRTALYQAAQQRTGVATPPLAVRTDAGTIALTLVVHPVPADDQTGGCFLVLFQECGETVDAPATLSRDQTVVRLWADVERLRLELTASKERHETQAAELNTANEELQASNEGLRVSTEELETSQEELQSVNEELRTVNQELQNNVEEQRRSNNHIQNLVNATEIATIFLDRDSRILLFTPRARKLFALISADRGRPLSDIRNVLLDVDLQADIDRVLERLERIEREVRTRHGGWELMRALPYRTEDDQVDGVVLTFHDISERKRNDARWRRSESRHRLILESINDYGIFTTDVNGTIDSWNPAATRLFGYRESDVLGQPFALLFTPEDRQSGAPGSELNQARQTGRASDERWHLRKDGSKFFASGTLAPLRDEVGGVTGFVKIARDLTERRRADEALTQLQSELETRVTQRTAELFAANQILDEELKERQLAENRIRDLIRQLLTIQEDERKRIARDLHDHLGQQVSALGLKLDAVGILAADAATIRVAVEDARRTVTELDRDLEFVTWELRPAVLDHLGLAVAIREYVRGWSDEFGIAADFHSRGFETYRLAGEPEINLYRITQEALNNVYKHADASHVSVLLERRGDQAVLVVEDDGTGFEPRDPGQRSMKGMGLVGMEERALLVNGELLVESAVGQGTTVLVQVPLQKDQ